MGISEQARLPEMSQCLWVNGEGIFGWNCCGNEESDTLAAEGKYRRQFMINRNGRGTEVMS